MTTPEPAAFDREVAVPLLRRVEGEGGLRIQYAGGELAEVALEIFEPPRYFEALLVGRAGLEAPDITARICGICPVAYQTSSCLALEAIASAALTPEIAALRRLLYCGEWLQSHALHVFFLHAPDFFGCTDAVELAQRDRAVVERGLRLKRAGNRLLQVVGGRAIHPVNVRVGGFYSAPDPAAIAGLVPVLSAALEDALGAAEWARTLSYPEVSRDYRFVALRGADAYPIESGASVVGPDGLVASPAQFAELSVEEHVAYSTALQSRLFGEAYLTGPLARFAHNRDLLPPLAAAAASAARLPAVCTNPYQSILIRTIELVAACEEALRLAEAYRPPEPAAVAVEPGAGRGFGASEAPRGLLLIGYETDADGDITTARISPPTAQNQLSIEADLRVLAVGGAALADDELARRCEAAVRNHDPCISCSAHFLDLEVQRT